MILLNYIYISYIILLKMPSKIYEESLTQKEKMTQHCYQSKPNSDCTHDQCVEILVNYNGCLTCENKEQNSKKTIKEIKHDLNNLKFYLEENKKKLNSDKIKCDFFNGMTANQMLYIGRSKAYLDEFHYCGTEEYHKIGKKEVEHLSYCKIKPIVMCESYDIILNIEYFKKKIQLLEELLTELTFVQISKINKFKDEEENMRLIEESKYQYKALEQTIEDEEEENNVI
ncbi:hypothetical protein AB837_00551 [bacterium AB1]|nr:hypothetical protein AB837_00551 [bacterium AB1]